MVRQRKQTAQHALSCGAFGAFFSHGEGWLRWWSQHRGLGRGVKSIPMLKGALRKETPSVARIMARKNPRIVRG
jgi:hypothetical protein